MCKNIEEVLKQATGIPTSCTVIMDGEARVSDDFVAILSKENGDAAIFYNTDALTLGMAMKMVSKAFVDCMMELPEEERRNVQEILGGEFAVSREEEPANE